MLRYSEQAGDYKQFIESLGDTDGDAEGKNNAIATSGNKEEDEVRVGIKDWSVVLELIFLLLSPWQW